jgi:hypothetical protein
VGRGAPKEDIVMNFSQRKVIALFQPQEWSGRKKDYAENIGELIEIDVTYRLVNLDMETIKFLSDDSTESDELVRGLHDHDGPFAVYVVEAAQKFFRVEDLRDVTQEILDEAKATVSKPAMTQQEYLSYKGVRCPFCESINLDAGDVETDAGGASQPVTCKDCGEEWVDQYKLVGYDKDPDAGTINETKQALADVIVTLFSEDGKCIILGFTKKGEKILDQRVTLTGEPEENTRKAVFSNKDVQVSVNGEKWRDIEKCGRLEEIVEAMLSNATYASIYALIHNSVPTCTCDHTQTGSVCRRYDDKDGRESVYSYGRYNKLGDFCPDKAVDLSGGRYDLADDSDTCLICANII